MSLLSFHIKSFTICLSIGCFFSFKYFNFYIIFCVCFPFHKKSVFGFFFLYISENSSNSYYKMQGEEISQSRFFFIHWRKRIINFIQLRHVFLGFLYFFFCNVKLCIHHSSLCLLYIDFFSFIKVLIHSFFFHFFSCLCNNLCNIYI